MLYINQGIGSARSRRGGKVSIAMKQLKVKTLKGTHFEIRVQPNDTIIDVKKNIEQVQLQGKKGYYPWGRQLLIHSGKVLKDETTLEENKISEDGFLVVMLGKPSATSVAQHPTPTEDLPQTSSESPAQPMQSDAQTTCSLVEGSNMTQTINRLLEMDGGNGDRETILRAHHAAYNNPERTVEYLYSGIPATAEIALPGGHFPSSVVSTQGADMVAAAPLFGVPNSTPFNMFPQGINSGGGGFLGFPRDDEHFVALRELIQENPEIIRPMLREINRQNDELLTFLLEHYGGVFQLRNEPTEALQGDMLDQPDHQDEMPHTLTVAPEDQGAIERLQVLGFERARVIEAFLACDRNEQWAANYLLEHDGEED